MFKLTTVIKFFFLFVLFLFSFAFSGNKLLAQQVSIQSFDTKSGTTATAHSLTGVTAGALLVLTTTADAPPANASVSSSPSLTWTKQVDAGATNSDNAEIWTAVYPAGGSISVTSNWGSWSQSSVCYIVLNAESTLGGASGTAVSQSAPSVTITTTKANSIIFGCTADFNRINGATRTLRDAATERLYYRDGNYTTYFYTKTATAIAAYTEGVSSPTGQQASTALLEIRDGLDTQAPSAITNLTSTGQTSTTIGLSWTAATDDVGVTGYDVYVDGVLNGTTATSTYTVTGLTPLTQYSIYVKAKDAAGNGTNSNTITPATATPPDTQAPSSFTLSSPGQTASTINLSWTAATDSVGVTGYDVYVGGVLNGTTATTTYTVTGLTVFTQYSIYVRAKDAAGNGTNSNTITPTTASGIDTIYRTPGIDSFFYEKGGNIYAVKDSTGVPASGSDNYIQNQKIVQQNADAWVKTLKADSIQFGEVVYSDRGFKNTVNGNEFTTRFDANNGFGFNFGGSGYWGGGQTFQVLRLAGRIYLQAMGTTDGMHLNTFPNNATPIRLDGAYTRIDRGLTVGGTSVPASAIVSFESTTKGTLLPRMTATQRTAISSPAIGLLVFDTDSSSHFQYTSGGWQNLRGVSSSGIDTIYRTPGVDSIKYVKNGITYAVKDSAGTTYTDANARTAISLTTTGTSGAATYDNNTGILNVPNYTNTITDLNSLSDVYITSPTYNDVLVYNVSGWVNSKSIPWNGTIKSIQGWNGSGGITINNFTSFGHYFFGTSPATLTLPTLSSAALRSFILVNTGTANWTIDANGTEAIFHNNTAIENFVLAPGESIYISASFASPNRWTTFFKSNGGTWGSITGALSNQTDLQNALNTKIDSITRTPGVDSFYYWKNGVSYAVKDSTGGGSQTLQQVFNAEVGGSVLTKTDTVQMNTHDLVFLNGHIGIGASSNSLLRVGRDVRSFLVVDPDNNSYYMGDANGWGNSTYINIDDANSTIEFNANGTMRWGLDTLATRSYVRSLGSGSGFGTDSTKWSTDSINLFNKNIGNVGIGTITPTAKFHTLGSMRFESFKNNEQGDSVLTTDVDGNLKMVYLPYGSSGSGSGASYTFGNGVAQANGHVSLGGSLLDSVKLNLNDKPFHFNSGSNRIFSFTPNGSFYNGNTNYDLTANSSKFNIGSNQDSVGYGSQLSFNGFGNTDALWMSRFNSSYDASEIRMNLGDEGGSADKFHIGYHQPGGSWKSNFVVQANGQVGLGTSEVNGDLSVGMQHGDKLSIGNNSWANKTIIATGTDAQTGDFTELKVPGSAANSAFLRLNKEGSIGIGTTKTDAGYKLLVNGRVKAVGMRVQAAANWPDYVFDSVYQLRSLAEVEKFIKTNKHLPEFPKAAQVEKEGHDVSEIQIKLLQKIEELTLYIIDQDKRVKELEEKNKKLDDQNKQIVQMQQQLDELKKLILTSK